MAFNIGVNVVEVDGSAAPAIVGAAVSVGAFNVLTRRGVPNKPLRVTSFAKFVEQFGSYFEGGLGAYLIKGFFDNGGQTAYVNRVIDTNAASGARAASVDLQDGAAQATLRLEAAFRGEPDPGTWANELFVRVSAASSAEAKVLETSAASVQGASLVEPVDMSALPGLTLRIDGAGADTEITFQAADFVDPGAATLGEIRNAINRRTNRVVASLGGAGSDQLLLRSSGELAKVSGGWSSLQITADNTTLGFTQQAFPVLGAPAARNQNGTRLSKLSDYTVGDALLVSDGALSARVKLMSVDQATGGVTWAPNIANIGSYDPHLLRVSNLEFDLTIALGAADDAKIVESHRALSMEADLPNYAPRILNHPLSGSRYVRGTDLASVSAVGVDLPVTAAGYTVLTQGTDGAPTANDFIGDQAAHTGFFAFDSYDVQLLASERSDATILTAALAYCGGRGDCIFVGSVPEGYVEAGQAVPFGQAFQGKNVFGALYGPWITVADPIGIGDGPLKSIPPTGHVMGTFARIETRRGIWKAPAGDEANLAGAIGVAYRLSDAEHTDLVKNGSINGIRAVAGAGIVIDASRTLSTDTRWLYVNVRLLFNFVKSSLRQGLRWAKQEPNRDFLWGTIKYGTVTPFLMRLWRQGAFGTGAPSEVFSVIIDATNNPPELVDQGVLNLEVYFYPSRPAETIVITVGQRSSGAAVSEA